MTFTVIGHFVRGRHRGKAFHQYVSSATNRDMATRVVNKWAEGNAKVLAIIEGQPPVHHPGESIHGKSKGALPVGNCREEGAPIRENKNQTTKQA